MDAFTKTSLFIFFLLLLSPPLHAEAGPDGSRRDYLPVRYVAPLFEDSEMPMGPPSMLTASFDAGSNQMVSNTLSASLALSPRSALLLEGSFTDQSQNAYFSGKAGASLQVSPLVSGRLLGAGVAGPSGTFGGGGELGVGFALNSLWNGRLGTNLMLSGGVMRFTQTTDSGSSPTLSSLYQFYGRVDFLQEISRAVQINISYALYTYTDDSGATPDLTQLTAITQSPLAGIIAPFPTDVISGGVRWQITEQWSTMVGVSSTGQKVSPDRILGAGGGFSYLTRNHWILGVHGGVFQGPRQVGGDSAGGAPALGVMGQGITSGNQAAAGVTASTSAASLGYSAGIDIGFLW